MKTASRGKISGRLPGEIDAMSCLGLVLFWFQTRGSIARVVPMAFGLTASVIHRWLKFLQHVLLCALQDHTLAKVEEPSTTNVKRHIKPTATKHPVLQEEKVWRAASGLKIPLQTADMHSVQNKHFNR